MDKSLLTPDQIREGDVITGIETSSGRIADYPPYRVIAVHGSYIHGRVLSSTLQFSVRYHEGDRYQVERGA